MSNISVKYDDAHLVFITSGLKLVGGTVSLNRAEATRLHKMLGDALKECKRISDADPANNSLPK
jgi:hypothetical protein